MANAVPSTGGQMPAEDVIAELSVKKAAQAAPAAPVTPSPAEAVRPLRDNETIVKVDGVPYRKRPGTAKGTYHMVRIG